MQSHYFCCMFNLKVYMTHKNIISTKNNLIVKKYLNVKNYLIVIDKSGVFISIGLLHLEHEHL